MAARRRPLCIFLSVLALFLIGTVIVLSSITYFLAIQPSAYLSDGQVPILDRNEHWNASEHGKVERIPRILHQTWRTNTLPEKWQPISQECRDLMPDYEYMLWTDNSSREFISEHYPWFLDTFNDYTYPIQRADAIRYFVLHHYGGVYFDLDIGCRRRFDPLLAYPVILPKTIPVGVSNDLIFSEKGHPFMAQTIHSLAAWDHSWILNYPTVMFSTGPMFLSAMYSLFTSSHAAEQSDPIRILHKSLYGKNAEGEAPHAFFNHFYGSSWHAGDSGFIAFLNHWGKPLMWVGLVVFVVGVLSIIIPSKQGSRYGLRRMSGYEVLFPRRLAGGWHYSSPSADDETDSEDVAVLSLPVNMRSVSPVSSEGSNDQYGRATSGFTGVLRRVRDRVSTVLGLREDTLRTPIRSRRQRQGRGILFFLPAIFSQSQDVDIGAPPPSYHSQVPLTPRSQATPEKQRFLDDELTVEGTSNSRLLEHGSLIEFGCETPTSSSHSRPRNSSHHRE